MNPSDLSARLGVDVSRETWALLDRFVCLVSKWNSTINLLAPNELSRVWERHVLDSAQCALIPSRSRGPWLDIGSGGGFPGLVVGIMRRGFGERLLLVERDRRKAAFLHFASRDLGLEIQVVEGDAGRIAPVEAEVVSARAVAGLGKLLPLIARHLAPDGFALLPKGEQFKKEIDEARSVCRFEFEAIPSVTCSGAAILKVWGVEHVNR
ncbi:MAG: 16S rRNA (guanine(527)-N(7))-methyltransferase RsmG [Gemmobacter sp.]